ncbi:hypothetical protein QX201_004057 [Fusarium graminearum]
MSQVRRDTIRSRTSVYRFISAHLSTCFLAPSSWLSHWLLPRGRTSKRAAKPGPPSPVPTSPETQWY